MVGSGRGFHLQMPILRSILNIVLMPTAWFCRVCCFRMHADGALPTFHHHNVTRRSATLMQGPRQRQNLHLYFNNWTNPDNSSYKITVNTENKYPELINLFLKRTEDPSLYRWTSAKCGGRAYKQKGRSGYTNLRNHLRTGVRPNFEKKLKFSSGQQTLQQMGFPAIRDRDVHDIIAWIISRNRLSLEVHHEVTRRVLRKKWFLPWLLRSISSTSSESSRETFPKLFPNTWL